MNIPTALVRRCNPAATAPRMLSLSSRSTRTVGESLGSACSQSSHDHCARKHQSVGGTVAAGPVTRLAICFVRVWCKRRERGSPGQLPGTSPQAHRGSGRHPAVNCSNFDPFDSVHVWCGKGENAPFSVPAGLSFANRNIAVDRKVGKALHQAAGLGPFNL